jgi:2,3-dihydroxybenzoate decarboxylase
MTQHDTLHALKTGGDQGYLRIATEEAFATREQIDVYLRMVRDGTADRGMTSLWGFYAQSPSERAMQIIERLLDLGERRIADMDATGIDKAILALTSPGCSPSATWRRQSAPPAPPMIGWPSAAPSIQTVLSA